MSEQNCFKLLTYLVHVEGKQTIPYEFDRHHTNFVCINYQDPLRNNFRHFERSVFFHRKFDVFGIISADLNNSLIASRLFHCSFVNSIAESTKTTSIGHSQAENRLLNEHFPRINIALHSAIIYIMN